MHAGHADVGDFYVMHGMDMRTAAAREIIYALRLRVGCDVMQSLQPHEEDILCLASELEEDTAEHNRLLVCKYKSRAAYGAFNLQCESSMCCGVWRRSTKPTALDTEILSKWSARVCESCGALLGPTTAERKETARVKRKAEHALLHASAQRMTG